MERLCLFLFLSLFLLLIPLEGVEVRIEGAVSEELLSLAASLSRIETERPLPSFLLLKKRVEAERVNLSYLLHAFGYYEGEILIDYCGTFPDTTVRITLLPGPLYTFTAPSILDKETKVPLFSPVGWGVVADAPACAQPILDTQEALLHELACRGHPLCTLAERKICVDPPSKTVSVNYLVDPGPSAQFGPVEIEGIHKVKEGFISRKRFWKEGEPYHPDKVACTDAYLQQSGLFSLVSVTHGDTVDDEGYIPMYIRVEEKRYRHMGAGISYSTDESVGVVAQWSHDNFSGWGDALSLNGEYSEVVKRATLLYGMPDLFGKKQDLLTSMEVRREDAPGFIEQEVSLLLRLSKKWSESLSFTYGIRYEYMLSTKSDNNANYNLFSLPLQLRWDTTNRLLTPTSGTTIAYFITPYQSVLNENLFFLKQEWLAMTYQPLTRSGRLLLALSGQIGSISGQARLAIPPPKRFYAGSSTALRGYKYLSVSPLEGKKPVGGRSFWIASIEPRLHLYEKLYAALFYDLGNVYATSFPLSPRKVLQSTGGGLIYHTPLGSFRVDIGFPLNKRKGIDKTFQIYASLGQAF